MNRRHFVLALMLLGAGFARALDYPNRPIRMLTSEFGIHED